MEHGHRGGVTTTAATTTIFISNLHCPSCITSIEASLERLKPQPTSVSHSIISHSITVRHDDALSADAITDALEHAGFEVYSVALAGDAAGASAWPLGGQQAAPRSNDWGLEQAVDRWSHAWTDAGLESRKRKLHVDQCKQCQAAMCHSTGATALDLDGGSVEKGSESLADEASDGGPRKRPSVSSRSTAPGSEAGAFVVVDGGAPRPELFRASFAVSGMTCAACVGSVTRAISQDPWVRDVNVVLLSNSATVTFEGGGNETKIMESIDDAGFDVSLEDLQVVDGAGQHEQKPTTKHSDMWSATYSIGGMTCSACVGAITNGLHGVDWIESVNVNLISNSATVSFRGKSHVEKITEMIEDLGYDASLENVVNTGLEQADSSERKVSIKVSGMYCHHCPERVLKAIYDTFGDRVLIDHPLSVSDPILRITYQPQLPDFTLRHIVRAIGAVDTEIEPTVYHPPTLEERSKQIHQRERRRILLRLALSVTVAIPTFIIGIVFMSLVKSSNPLRQYFMESMWSGQVPRAQWALFILGTAVYFFAADIFHIRTLSGIRAMWRRGSPVPLLDRFYRFGNMNMLISLGTSIAYFASIAALAIDATQSSSSSSGESTSYYFDSVVFLTMFLLVGKFLEAYSKARTGDAVSSLGLLRPNEALLVDSKGANDEAQVAEDKISVDLLEVGDTVRVPHGSSPPFDGAIVSGDTNFDESSLTGESRPVSKTGGDAVFSGTINKGSPVTVKLTSISGTSMLDQIIRVVREGQTRRAPVERVADILTSHFVPFVVAVGILTWLVWLALGVSGALPPAYLDVATGGWPFWSLQFSIAVFVVACPCGIGLAAPTALFVGGGLAAKHGILVKGGGEAFQEASMLDCVVFDKTGTLTEGGQPVVTDHTVSAGASEKFVLSVASALEEHSSHPIASSIVRFCLRLGEERAHVADVEEVPGKGMKASVQVEEKQVMAIIGNEALMAEYAVEVNAEMQETINGWKMQGKSIALLATGESGSITLKAAFSISDALRPEAGEVIRSLKSRGVAVWLLSGDNAITANAVGAAVGIPSSNVIAGVLPEQKAEKIKYLQQTLTSRRSHSGVLSRRAKERRATVAMVGDGINDAPALATADVGVAIGSGSDVALSTASFVLVSSDLRSLLTLVDLSRTVFQRVWINFAWALVYNLIALPVAAGVLYPLKSGGGHVRLDPVWASLAMALSSVSVVSSSLALRTRIPGLGFRASKVV
ncbi:hypothetical protein MBLNU459_g3605t1 [Dothideomycetes sp. NU459]